MGQGNVFTPVCIHSVHRGAILSKGCHERGVSWRGCHEGGLCCLLFWPSGMASWLNMAFCYDLLVCLWCGLLLWPSGVAFYYGLLVRPSIVAFWLKVAFCYGLRVWSSGVAFCYGPRCGLLLWPSGVAFCYSLLVWPSVVLFSWKGDYTLNQNFENEKIDSHGCYLILLINLPSFISLC